MECRPEIGWSYQHLLLSIEKNQEWSISAKLWFFNFYDVEFKSFKFKMKKGLI